MSSARTAVALEEHPSLLARTLVAEFPRALGEFESESAAWRSLAESLSLEASSPLERSEELRQAVRDMLRHGGYKPTGRGKPASEYLVGAAQKGRLGSINPAVDACNVISLHSGLPISVVDLELAREPLSISVQPTGSSYVFNASEQLIDVSGLICLCDAQGACANAVKDSQRTKTHAKSRRTLSVIWGVREFESQLDAACTEYRARLEALGCQVSG